MISDTTIRAIEQSIDNFEYKCRDRRVWMKQYRKESLRYYRKYKAAKAEFFQLETKIKELKEDKRRIKDDK